MDVCVCCDKQIQTSQQPPSKTLACRMRCPSRAQRGGLAARTPCGENPAAGGGARRRQVEAHGGGGVAALWGRAVARRRRKCGCHIRFFKASIHASVGFVLFRQLMKCTTARSFPDIATFYEVIIVVYEALFVSTSWECII
eukprot:6200068-Pleurochrysis_carterae.AAC.1